MAEKDVMGSFDYDQFGGAGLFLKFKADKPVTVRILTTDPVISQTEFEDKKTGETNLNTRFSYIVYNFTEGKAQILSASAAMSRKFGELHMDPDFGANIRKIDIKITPTGEQLERRYDIQVLPTTKQLTNEMVKEAQGIALDDLVNDSKGRMSEWQASTQTPKVGSSGSAGSSGYSTARDQAEKLRPENNPKPPEDVVIEDIGDEPINLDDIPF